MIRGDAQSREVSALCAHGKHVYASGAYVR